METIKKIGGDRLLFIFFSISFFVGIWHAFPILDIVSDEMYFVGGVLRAMENHTILPQVDDVPYGTITYLLNYIATVFNLIVLVPIFSFKISALKLYLIQSPSIMYLSTRIISSIISIFYLIIISKFLKKEHSENKVRYFLLILVFTNVLTTTILHTGKQHVLSIFLVIASFYYLYMAVANEASDDRTVRNKNASWSIIFSFLALSNLPLNGYSLITIPILIYYFKSDRDFLKKIGKYILIGMILSGAIIALNSGSIRHQIISVFTDYKPLLVENDTIPNMSFGTSLTTYTKKLIYLFPLILLTLLLSIKSGIKNRKLFTISTVYFLTYFFTVVFLATWPVEFGSFLRYLVPLNFFLFFILSSLNLKFKNYFYPIIAVSLLYFILTLYYLSIPTTYNKAVIWIDENLRNVDTTIISSVHDFRLTKNKKSSIMAQDLFCGTKCKSIIENDLNSDFKPLVIDDQSLMTATSTVKSYKGFYFIEEKPLTDPRYEKIAEFTNNSKDYFSVDYNLGFYLNFDYLKIDRLGKNIYIYRAKY